MPPVTLLSPYSGRPVVVREEDLGRAIRDDAGRVFYVVEDNEHGRYASMTRKGSPKDLERYRAMQTGGAPNANGGPAPAAQAAANTIGATQQTIPAFDATGTKRRNPVGIVALVVLALLTAAGVYVALSHPEWLGIEPKQNPPVNSPTDAPSQPDASDSSKQGNQPTPKRPAIDVRAQAPRGDALSPGSFGKSTPDPAIDATVQPTVGESPAVFPESPEAFADLLAQADTQDTPPSDDPTPVIVPARTWRPDQSPRVLSGADADTRPYADFSHTASGLRYKLTHRTDGPPAKAGHYLQVRYTMQSLDGKSLIDDASQSFVLMTGQAIRAFDEGLAGVREGEQMRLFVPRGHSEAGELPGIDQIPDQPFLLDVQLVAVKPGVTHIVEQEGDADAEPAMPGDTVAIHYVARVEGKEDVIDATAQRGEPMRLTLGRHEVITGLELGIAGMRKGETRLLSIPPYLAYGEDGAAGGLIPPNAVLSFRVTLVGIDAGE